ncbi:MAG: HAMP domain-containing protein [Clostridium butyricum]|nr:HAMP domain-containing protein [Clostridium butyricum]
MINVSKWFINKSIGKKLMIYFGGIILTLIITITYLGNLSYMKSINISQNENTNQIIKQISSNIDFYVNKSENIINYMSTDPRILTFLNDNHSENDNIEDAVYKSIYKFTKFNPEIAGIMVVNTNGGYISDVMNKVSRDSLINEEWYIKSIKDPNNMHLYTKPIGRNIDNIFKYSADEVFSMSKAIIDDKTKETTGVILIDIKLDVIKDVIENSKPGTAGFVFIVDNNGEIVYTPVNNIVYRIHDEWIREMNNEIITKNIDRENYKLTKSTSDYTGWQTISVFPESESIKIVEKLKYISIFIGIIALIISGAFAAIFTKSIVRPIYKLKKLMKEAQDGNLDVFFNSKCNDEIGELGESFNTMVREIKNLLNLIQIEEKKKRKAEMNVLQAQIKPHFMYNTLDTIRWMAEEKEDYEIVDIIESFTKLLRISLSKGKEIISVNDELNHIKSYLEIQKMRYEDKLEYEIYFDERILNYKVVKLILQPLIENAIYHGIKEKRGNGKIVIIAEEYDDILHFSVSDNGKGIDEKTLKEIKYMLENGRSEESNLGYGIFNVNERINLMYGKQYGVKFTSIYGKGTRTEIMHPIVIN